MTLNSDTQIQFFSPHFFDTVKQKNCVHCINQAVEIEHALAQLICGKPLRCPSRIGFKGFCKVNLDRAHCDIERETRLAYRMIQKLWAVVARIRGLDVA